MSSESEYQTQVEKITLPLGEATAAGVALEMGSGSVTVGGGATSLLDAAFTYEDPEQKPELNYDVVAGYGKLIVKQPNSRLGVLRDVKNVWDLRLQQEIPLDLSLKLGSGKAALTLGDTNLTGLHANVASGKLLANLTGDLPNLDTLDINAASGHVGLDMDGDYPALRDMQVRIASGKLSFRLKGSYQLLEKLLLNSASGNLNIDLNGEYAALKALRVENVSGLTNLDLSGAWQHDLQAVIHAVSGIIRIKLPQDVGVSLHFTSLSGKVHAPDFQKRGNTYVNAAFEESAVKLHLKVSSVSSKVIMKL